MKKLLLLLVLSLMSFAAGCTLTENTTEAHRRRVHILDIQSKMFVEDVENFLLMDRSSNLTQWNARVGY